MRYLVAMTFLFASVPASAKCMDLTYKMLGNASGAAKKGIAGATITLEWEESKRRVMNDSLEPLSAE